jgi:hypothetical protein
MNNTNTGGSAFPALYAGNGAEGMTLRDYFAAKAMQGFAMDDALCNEASTAPEWFKDIAESAYELADAMLKARNK